MSKISIIIPVYNESDTIRSFFSESEKYRDSIAELIFVDDGSTDDTVEVIRSVYDRTSIPVKIVSMTNNIGKDKAAREGLLQASGELSAVMDADLQFPFEELTRMAEVLRTKGLDMAIALKQNYGSFWNLLFRLFSLLTFNRVFASNMSDFMVGKSELIRAALTRYQQSYIFSLKGVMFDLSKRTELIKVSIRGREQGASKMNFLRLLNIFTSTFLLAFPNITRVAFAWSIIFGTFAVGYSGRIIYHTMVHGTTAGFPSLMITMLTSFSVVFLFIGIMGEYLNAIVKQTVQKKPFVHANAYYENRSSAVLAQPDASSSGMHLNYYLTLTGDQRRITDEVATGLSQHFLKNDVHVHILDGSSRTVVGILTSDHGNFDADTRPTIWIIKDAPEEIIGRIRSIADPRLASRLAIGAKDGAALIVVEKMENRGRMLSAGSVIEYRAWTGTEVRIDLHREGERDLVRHILSHIEMSARPQRRTEHG